MSNKLLHTNLLEAQVKHDEEIKALEEKYKSDVEAINDEILTRVRFYNAVVNNTARKFSYDEFYSFVKAGVMLNTAKFSFYKYDTESGEYVFRSDNQERRLHENLLLDDPIAVAIHTRKFIRAKQDEAIVKNYKAFKGALATSERHLKLAQKSHNEAQAGFELASEKLEEHRKRINEYYVKKARKRLQKPKK